MGGVLTVWRWEEGSEGQLSIHSDLIVTSRSQPIGGWGSQLPV